MEVVFKWEKIDNNTDITKAPDGWVLRSKLYGGGVHQIFIKDMNYTWKINEPS